jgi:TetR/AcrR family transcriptional repressor of nem operon
MYSIAEISTEMPEKKGRLVEAAIHLMLRQGFGGTSVDQICAEAQVTKGSFFHYFESKEEICHVAIDAWANGWVGLLQAAQFEAVPDPLARIDRLFEVMHATYLRPESVASCLIGTIASEVSATNRRLGDHCEKLLDGWAGVVRRLLVDAKAAQPPEIDFDPDQVAGFVLSLVQGSFLVAKMRQDPQVIQHNLNHAQAYVHRLFGRSRPPG